MQIRLLDDATIGIFFEYRPKLVGLVKSIPGSRFEPSARFWHIPVDGIALVSVQKLMQYGFQCDSGVLDRLNNLLAPVGQNLSKVIPGNFPLYDFQRETVEFMVTTGNCLNANFVGSGKTLTSIAVAETLEAKKVLIIAPKSVVDQWKDIEIPKWIKEHAVHYTVIGYERLRIDVLKGNFPLDWDVIITDEAHRLASINTKLYKAIMKLRAKYKFALTATPVMNKPDDLFGLMNWLRPGMLGSWYQFANRYIVKDMWGSPKYYKNMDELAERCKPFIIKKSLEEVGMQLPPYTEEIIPITLNETERKNYDLIKAEMLFDIEPQIINKIENPVMLQNTVVKLGKLFEICDSMELIGEGNDSSKLEVLKEHLESRLANGEKAIIISRFARMAEILNRELALSNPILITGKTQNRQELLDKFNNDNKYRILIGTTAIEAGLNLQAANVLYNFDSAWNPARMEQRAGRIYRNGQNKPVFIYNLVTHQSVETWLQKKLAKKQEISDRLLPKTFVEIKEMLTN